MLDEIRRLALVGVGALSVAEDEISATIASLRQKEKLSKDEGERILAEWRDRVTANRREVEAFAIKAVQDALTSVGAPTREELDILKARVDTLESKSRSE